MTKITKDQTRALRSVASKVFKDNDRYHEWLMDNYGYSSTLELSKADAIQAINLLLKSVGQGIMLKQDDAGKLAIGNWLTPAQRSKIEKLEKELGWQDNPSRLIGFIKRQTRLNKSVRMLSVKEAQKVINGLNQMLEVCA